jgi:hypothetical protein
LVILVEEKKVLGNRMFNKKLEIVVGIVTVLTTVVYGVTFINKLNAKVVSLSEDQVETSTFIKNQRGLNQSVSSRFEELMIERDMSAKIVGINIGIFNSSRVLESEKRLKKYLKMIISGVTFQPFCCWKGRYELDQSKIIYVENEYKVMAYLIEELLPGKQVIMSYENKSHDFSGLEEYGLAIIVGNDLAGKL